MTTRKEATEMCLQFPDVYEDYPFDDFNWTVMRHKGNKKTFAFIFEYRGQMRINVKVLPELGMVWRQEYAAVSAPYHVNKLHWIMITLDGTLSDDVIRGFLRDSFNLTKPKVK